MVKREFTFPSADGKTAIHAVEWLRGLFAVFLLYGGVRYLL